MKKGEMRKREMWSPRTARQRRRRGGNWQPSGRTPKQERARKRRRKAARKSRRRNR